MQFEYTCTQVRLFTLVIVLFMCTHIESAVNSSDSLYFSFGFN